MNGIEWMEALLSCEAARQNIPMELQATMPLPVGDRTAACWYYRLECPPTGPEVTSPERYVLWDVDTMKILEIKAMAPAFLGSGGDLLTKEHREQEDAFLEGTFTSYLKGALLLDEMQKTWLSAAPKAMQAWLQNTIEAEQL